MNDIFKLENFLLHLVGGVTTNAPTFQFPDPIALHYWEFNYSNKKQMQKHHSTFGELLRQENNSITKTRRKRSKIEN